MKLSTRALVGLIVIDTALVAGMGWLILQVRTGTFNAPDPAAAIREITTMGGGAIGIVTVILGLAFLHHKRKGR